ncbi:MAG: sec-independent protein translocase protein TatB [Gammaproteobacteria bacterium]|jgi:sec-independent protein translocase protein TatB
MFDMGFTEVVLIGIVALVVIGPERLPGVAITVGKYVGRLKRFVTNVRTDVESEFKTDEIRKLLAAQQEELSSLKDVVSEAKKGLDMSGVAKSIDDSMASVLGKSEIEKPVEPESTLEQSPTEPTVSLEKNASAESTAPEVVPEKNKSAS